MTPWIDYQPTERETKVRCSRCGRHIDKSRRARASHAAAHLRQDKHRALETLNAKPTRVTLIALALLSLTGCATRLYDSRGRLGFETYADAEQIHVKLADGTELDAAKLNHSTPTTAATAGATALTTAAGAAIIGAHAIK